MVPNPVTVDDVVREYIAARCPQAYSRRWHCGGSCPARRAIPGRPFPGRPARHRDGPADRGPARRAPVDRARFLAAFAYILTRAAAADLDISHDESHAIERLVAEHGGLPEPQAVLVAQIARNQSLLYGGTEDFLVTRQFRELASSEDRLALLRCCYLVGAADDTITARIRHAPADRQGARPRPRRGQRHPP